MTLNPGRELDELIAMKVMGWRKLPEHIFGIRCWAPPTLTEEAILKCSDLLEKGVPPYSTDIAAAWEVVEKIKGIVLGEMEMTFVIDYLPPGWQVGWRIYNHVNGVEANTAPHAICLAALKAINQSPKNCDS